MTHSAKRHLPLILIAVGGVLVIGAIVFFVLKNIDPKSEAPATPETSEQQLDAARQLEQTGRDQLKAGDSAAASDSFEAAGERYRQAGDEEAAVQADAYASSSDPSRFAPSPEETPTTAPPAAVTAQE